MNYVPKLDDYVSWRNVEGWVYYIDDDHLTVEISVRPKEDDLVPRHKKHHCLVVVQKYQLNGFCNKIVTLKSIQDAPIKENKTITHSIRKNPIAIPNFAEAFPPLS